MGYDISAYVEKKDGDKWVLVSERPISSRLKYIIDDYKDFNGLNWDDLSDGLKGIFKKDEDGKVYHNFYVARIEDIEAKIAGKIKESYVRLNTIVKALGCQRFQSDDGEELEPWGDDEDKEKLTLPINKQLIDELQYDISDIRKIGQREAFDLFASELMSDYDATYRIVFVLT
jgi:hypothetical protein